MYSLQNIFIDGENVGQLSDNIGVCVCTNAKSKAQEGELIRKTSKGMKM